MEDHSREDPVSFALLNLIPVVSKLWHVQKKLVPPQTRHTASHNPRRRLSIVFSDHFLKFSDILIRPPPFASSHFVTLCENKSQRYLQGYSKKLSNNTSASQIIKGLIAAKIKVFVLIAQTNSDNWIIIANPTPI